MKTNIREEQDWLTLLSFLPCDLDGLAWQCGALLRRRSIRSGEDLLRLALVYADDGMSLRETSAWAGERGIAQLSDVATLKRLRKSCEFLRSVLSYLLPRVEDVGSSLRIKVVDATTISRQRAKGTDFRVHVGYDLGSCRITGVDLTSAKEGERLDRLACSPGEVIVADRGYPGRIPLYEVSQRGAQALIRFHPTSLPLRDQNGVRLSLLDIAEELKIGQILDLAVETLPVKDVPAIAGRLIVVRKEAGSIERDMERLRQRAREDGREVGMQATRAAQFVFVFTTLSPKQASARTVLDIYRLRWQIEMLFKRAKGIISLGETLARDLALCECMILSKLILLLLLQAHEAAFFPWGYPLVRREPLANP